MMLYLLIAAALSAAPVPASPPPQPASSSPADIDPARLAAARRLIAITLPPGSLAKMMNNIAPGTMARVLAGLEAADTAHAAQHAADPAYQARLHGASELAIAELVKVQAASEPMYFDAFAVAYARRFTVAQLDEIIAFVSTPTGLRYASSQGEVTADPAVQAALNEMARRRTAAMPAMLAKVAAAMKDEALASVTKSPGHVP